jgi:hypothetical protein
MDLRTEVIAALDRVIASGSIEKAIEDAVGKTVKSIMEDQLRSYSDIGKLIEASVKKSLAMNGELDLPSYNDTLLKIIRKQVQSYTEDTIQRQVAKNLEELLAPPPESIKLSDLVEQYRKHLTNQLDEGDGYSGEFTFLMDHGDRGYTHIELSDDPKVKRYNGDIRLGVDREGKIYTLSFGKREVEKDLFAGPFYQFEKSLFQMKAAGTKLILDVESSEIDTSYGYDPD